MKHMTVKETLERVKSYFQINEFTQGEELLLKLEKQNFAPVFVLLGNIYERTGKYNLAINQFNKAIKLNKNNGEAYNNLGVVYKNKGVYMNAIFCFQKALTCIGERADIHYNLGNTYKALENYSRAIDEFNKALELDPDFIMAYNNLGIVFEEINNLKKAEAIYKKGLEIDPNNPNIRYNLGVIYKLNGKNETAKEEFEYALRTKPGWIDAKNNLGVILHKMNKNKEAMNIFKDIHSSDPENLKVLNNMGIVYNELGKFDEAKKYYRKAIEINPNYTRATYNLGTLFEQQNQYSDALKEFENLLKQDPVNIAVRYKLASVFLSLEHYDRSIEHFIKILDTEPEHTPTLRSLARAYLKSGEKEKATECYKRLKQIDNKNKDFHLDIAYIMKEKGDYKKAEQEVNIYLKANPEDLRGRILLGEIYDHLGHTKHAIQVFKDTIDIHPDKTEAFYCLARMHRKNNNQLKAIETFEKLITIQKTRGSRNDLDQLKDSLELYESTILEYEKEHKDEWLKSIKKLTEPIPIKYETNEIQEQTTGLDELMQVEEESVPILNIGDLKPVFAVKEEEELIKLEEDDEEIIDIGDEPGYIKDELKIEDDIKKDDIQNLIDDSLLPLSHMLKKLVEKEENTQEPGKQQREQPPVLNENKRPEFEQPQHLDNKEYPEYEQHKPVRIEPLPKQIAMQPFQVVNYPTNPLDSGVVNSLKDTIIEQKKILELIQQEVSKAFDLLKNQKKTIPIKIFPPIKIVRTLPKKPEDKSNEYKVEYQNEEEKTPEEKTENNLSDESEENYEKPSEEKIEQPVEKVEQRVQPAEEKNKPVISRLFDYLKNLTNYLPEQEKESGNMKDLVLRMEYLSHKLSGSPGLKKKIEKKHFHRRKNALKEAAPPATTDLSRNRILGFFEKLKKYSSHLPDKIIGKSLAEKVGSLISRILSLKKNDKK